MRKFFFFLLAFSLIVMSPSLTIAVEAERVNTLEEQNIEQKIQQLSEEWQRHLLDAVNHFLERELTRLRTDQAEPRESLNRQIEKHKEEIKNGSNDPKTFIALSRLYDRMKDGANAIINAKKAEKIFADRKSVKGTAQARRSLRNYFEKYDYKPEDFELSP